MPAVCPDLSPDLPAPACAECAAPATESHIVRSMFGSATYAHTYCESCGAGWQTAALVVIPLALAHPTGAGT